MEFEVCERYAIENVWSFLVWYFLVALESQIIYIYNERLQVESIGASPMWIARKTVKFFTCLGGFSQLRHTIVPGACNWLLV